MVFLLFLISNEKDVKKKKKKKKKRNVTWVYKKYTSGTKYSQVPKVQVSIKLWTEKIEQKYNTAT